ncbi:MAG: bifunctional protein-serine/threonine kinase/phosphatase [Magnetococcales bacterium]|nr:bifunctional protein-serine/threonine kinase/phosphatase [Magnetococcales bacterium]
MNLPSSNHELKLIIGQATSRGPDHERNEDFHGATTGEGRERGIVVCVADGIGGSADGRLASEVTVRAMLEDCVATPLGWKGVRVLYTVANSLNDWLFREGRWRKGGLGTTLVAALFRDRGLSILSVGDSRLYRWREGRLTLLTRDHLFGGPDLAVLTKAVGLDDRFTPDLREEVLREQDRYLLVSDGVWRAVREHVLRRWLEPALDPQETAQGLVEEARRHGRDDATAVVVAVVSLPEANLPELLREWRDRAIQPPPAVGDRVDGYHILRILAKGMQGVVVLARDEEGGQDVVMKFPDLLAASDPAWMEQFAREEWIGLRVRHPQVLAAQPPADTRRKAAYHVWQSLTGQTLEQVRQQRGKRGISATEATLWLCQTAKGLLALHRQGIIHRDVKPDNLFLTTDQRVVVMDFGAARITGLSPLMPEPAGQRVAGGTPGFMAPELYQGEPGDAGSDLFALGVTGYLLLAGSLPFGQPESHLVPDFQKKIPLAILRPDLPPSLTSIIERCLALDARNRPGDLGEFLSWMEQPELWSTPPARLPLLHRNPLRFYQTGFWIFLLTTVLLTLWRLRG